jgi:hypothetical protein
MDAKKQNERKGQAGRSSKKLVAGIIALIVVIAIAVGGWLLVNQYNSTPKGAAVEKDAYQAVFLTNGQVYFGHLQNTSGEYLSLNDIYYLQVQQSLQPGGTDAAAADATNATDASKVQLIKLGNELHGPQDHMQISSKQVLFWENLKDNGKVVQAIDNYKQNPTK